MSTVATFRANRARALLLHRGHLVEAPGGLLVVLVAGGSFLLGVLALFLVLVQSRLSP